MTGNNPATWRIVYKRAIAGDRTYGIKQKEYLLFPDDLKNLRPDYVAVLECKESTDTSWYFVAYVIVCGMASETFVLIDDKGEKLVNTTFTKNFMKEYFKDKPSYNSLINITK